MQKPAGDSLTSGPGNPQKLAESSFSPVLVFFTFKHGKLQALLSDRRYPSV
jgi:hypothetical protein